MTEHDITKAATQAGLAEFVFQKDPCDVEPIQFLLRWANEIKTELGPAAPAGFDALSDDPDQLHQQLLDVRTKVGRHHPARRNLEALLARVRAHSALYTPRVCECVSRRWRDFLESANDRLPRLLQAGDWAVTGEERLYEDWTRPRRGTFRVTRLIEYVGVGQYSPLEALPHRLVVRVLAADHLELTVRTGRTTRTVTMRALPPELASVASALRLAQHPCNSAAGRVLNWPWQTRAIAAAKAVDGDTGTDRQKWLQALVDARSDTLTDGECAVAVKLAPTWVGTPQALLETARDVSAPASSGVDTSVELAAKSGQGLPEAPRVALSVA